MARDGVRVAGPTFEIRRRQAAPGEAGGAAPSPGPAHCGVFSTDALPVADQFDAWHSRVRGYVDLVPLAPPRAGYAATNRLWHLGSMAYSHVSAQALGFSRTAEMIRRDSIDHWMLLRIREGSTTIRIGQRTITAKPGIPVIIPLGRPFDGQRADADWRALFLPRDTFAPLAASLDAASGLPIDTPLGRLLDDFLDSLDRLLPALSREEINRLPGMVSALIAASVGPTVAPDDPVAREALDGSRRERVRRLIRANLGAHTLGPRTLCRMAGLSRSALYRLFEGQGGVAAVIQRERLRAAQAALSDPDDRRSIQAIAESLAFADASTFSRAFRGAFGCAPREARHAAQAGMPLAAPRGDVRVVDQADFVGLLRRL